MTTPQTPPVGADGHAASAPQPRDASTGQFRSMSDAVTALEALLPPEGEQADEPEAEETGAEPELNSDEELGEEDAEGTKDEAADEEAEDEEPGSDDEEAEEQAPRGRKFTVRVDGKDETVEEAELIAGYQRQADYTRKTQAHAKERQQFQQELTQARQERTEYAQLLPRLRQALAQGMGQEPNWAELEAQDAANGTNRLTTTWIRWQQQKQRLAAVDAENAKVQQRQAAEQQAQMDQQHAAERDALYKALPSWKDKKVAKRESLAIARVMQAAGYNDDDLVVKDHRALIIARKAALYDQLQARKGPLQTKMRQAPTVRPGGGSPAPQTQKTQAAKRFGQSGSVKDAASLLEHLI